MKRWSTDGSFESDGRYSPFLRWAFRQDWMPVWVFRILFWTCRRG